MGKRKFWVGGRRLIQHQNASLHLHAISATVSGCRGRQITRGMTRVRQAPLPSLLQMDLIKPLAGKWVLMTPSGPILGLNKWQKIKLLSKLQGAFFMCRLPAVWKPRRKCGGLGVVLFVFFYFFP